MSNTDLIPRLIIDTDFETDCDDAGALAVAHKLADENIIELAAVNASVNSPLPALGVAAFNAAFGRRNLPVGCNTSSADTPEYNSHREKTADMLYHYRLPEICYASENSLISSSESGVVCFVGITLSPIIFWFVPISPTS